jgi:hypothetical protein
MQAACLPNFFILGAQKAGTSALYQVLNQHPQIGMSRIKEPRFFISDRVAPAFRGPGAEEFIRGGVWALKEYQSLFSCPSPRVVRGEASPVYLSAHAPDQTARRIATLCPEAKLIALLRDPTERAFSAYLHHRRLGLEPHSDFARALAEEEARLRAGWLPGWGYRSNGCYSANLAPYLELFPREQILLLSWESWNGRPAEIARRILKFLNVTEDFAPDLHHRHNVSLLPRMRWMTRWRTAPDWLKRLNQYRPALPLSQRKALEDYFKPRNALLATLAGPSLNAPWL